MMRRGTRGLAKETGGNTCNEALVNKAPALKRYRNVQTKLHMMLIFPVL